MLARPDSHSPSSARAVEVHEASIAQLRDWLASGATTSVGLVEAYLARIAAFDEPGSATALNAVVVRNERALDEAADADRRRASGRTLGPLDGIPYTAKDSFLVRGLTAASYRGQAVKRWSSCRGQRRDRAGCRRGPGGSAPM